MARTAAEGAGTETITDPRDSLWAPQLTLKRPQIPSNRDHKALNRGTLGGVGSYGPLFFLEARSIGISFGCGV